MVIGQPARRIVFYVPKLHALYLDMFALSHHSEIEELKKEMGKQKREAEEVQKALDDKIAEEKVRNGELDPDEVKWFPRTTKQPRRKLAMMRPSYI